MLLNHKSQSGVFGNLKIDLPKLYTDNYYNFRAEQRISNNLIG